MRALVRSARRIPVDHPKSEKMPGDALEMTTVKRASCDPDRWAEDERLSRVGRSASLDVRVHLARRCGGLSRQADRRRRLSETPVLTS